MTEKLAHIIHIFDKSTDSVPYKMHDNVAKFSQRSSIKFYKEAISYSDIFNYYFQLFKLKKDEESTKKFLSLKNWREKILNLRNYKILDNYKGQILDFDWVTSYDVIAEQLGLLEKNSLFQIAAIGITKTSDNFVLLGIRSVMDPINAKPLVEIFGHGLIGFPPGGNVSFKKTYVSNPIKDTLINEMQGEVGFFRISSYKPIGIFYANKPGPSGYKFLSLIEIDASLSEVISINAKTNNYYTKLLENGNSINKSREILKTKNYPKDAWEHNPMFGIYNDTKVLKNLLKISPHLFSGIGYGSLTTYLEWLERE
ncbi:hypothetical protein J4221_02535 [Candidatus Pacearchaeota archaeon]|nr:hypothetical protein [Candidatus Pacearchaeota archaeon]